jgi:hypothetical protein
MSLIFQCSDVECPLFKPLHYLQVSTKNLPNTEGVVRKTINPQPKVMLRLEENSNWPEFPSLQNFYVLPS